MLEKIKKWYKKEWYWGAICFIIATMSYCLFCNQGYRICGIFAVFVCVLLFAFRPNSKIYMLDMENSKWLQKTIIVCVCIATILFSILPMSLIPIWNGEYPAHRNQYELITESFLEGRLDFNYGDEWKLEKVENPYDLSERWEKVKLEDYHYDHAYYKGHYYMYFGVVPVFLIFMPYRLLFGHALTTYHATQLFALAIIVGFFMLFYLLSKLFFKKIPFIIYLALSTSFSVASIWYSIAEPALYCTAITSGIALEIWSLYFFIRAVWVEEKENRQIVFATIGALLGALVFGSRPPIALANLLVIPMLFSFLKGKKRSWKLVGKLIMVMFPYVVVAALLMLYNYARFENPFEFGQRFQLTIADQTKYNLNLNFETLINIYNGIINSIFGTGKLSKEFPFLQPAGVIYNFPILLFGFIIFSPKILKELKECQVLLLLWFWVLSVVVIISIQVLWSPILIERYHMDVYFLLFIFCFIILGFIYRIVELKNKPFYNFIIMFFTIITLLNSMLFCLQSAQQSLDINIYDSISRKLHFLL